MARQSAAISLLENANRGKVGCCKKTVLSV